MQSNNNFETFFLLLPILETHLMLQTRSETHLKWYENESTRRTSTEIAVSASSAPVPIRIRTLISMERIGEEGRQWRERTAQSLLSGDIKVAGDGWRRLDVSISALGLERLGL